MAATAPFLIHSEEEEEEDSLILISLHTFSSLEQRLLPPDAGPPVPPQLLRTRPFPATRLDSTPEEAVSLQAFICLIP